MTKPATTKIATATLAPKMMLWVSNPTLPHIGESYTVKACKKQGHSYIAMIQQGKAVSPLRITDDEVEIVTN